MYKRITYSKKNLHGICYYFQRCFKSQFTVCSDFCGSCPIRLMKLFYRENNGLPGYFVGYCLRRVKIHLYVSRRRAGNVITAYRASWRILARFISTSTDFGYDQILLFEMLSCSTLLILILHSPV